LKWKKLKSDWATNYTDEKKLAGRPASPSARQPAGRAQKRNPFYHVGPARPDPFNTGQKRAGPKRAGLARFDTPTLPRMFLLFVYFHILILLQLNIIMLIKKLFNAIIQILVSPNYILWYWNIHFYLVTNIAPQNLFCLRSQTKRILEEVSDGIPSVQDAEYTWAGRW